MLLGQAYLLYQRMTSPEVLQGAPRSAMLGRLGRMTVHLCDVCGRSFNLPLLSRPVRESGEDMLRVQLV